MAYSMPPAELFGTFAGIVTGEVGKSLGRTVARAVPVAGKAGRAVSEAMGATSAHFIGAATAKGLWNVGLGDVFGLCMNTMVTSPTSAGLHGVWVLLENLQAGEEPK